MISECVLKCLLVATVLSGSCQSHLCYFSNHTWRWKANWLKTRNKLLATPLYNKTIIKILKSISDVSSLFQLGTFFLSCKIQRFTGWLSYQMSQAKILKCSDENTDCAGDKLENGGLSGSRFFTAHCVLRLLLQILPAWATSKCQSDDLGCR